MASVGLPEIPGSIDHIGLRAVLLTTIVGLRAVLSTTKDISGNAPEAMG